MPAIREEIIEEIPDLIWTVGNGRGRGETYERMIDRAARKSGISYDRLRNYFYRRVKKPLAEEYVVLKQWAALRADAETNRLMAEHDRLAKDAEDAGTNISMGTDRVQLDIGSLFSGVEVVL